MNSVFLSGRIVGQPALLNREDQAPHLIFHLSVSHKRASGEICYEQYRINAWNKTALWGYGALKEGQAIVLEGYLTQRAVKSAKEVVRYVEVTARELSPGREKAENQ